MSVTLSPSDRGRLAKLCGLLGSDHAGERAAAALHATRVLQQAGLTWADFVETGHLQKDAAPRCFEWRQVARACLDRPDDLTAWESQFLATLLRRRSTSTKQTSCLAGIAERLGITAT